MSPVTPQASPLKASTLARAALTYLAEPADPALGALLEVCTPEEILAAIKAGILPIPASTPAIGTDPTTGAVPGTILRLISGTGSVAPSSGDRPARRAALERAFGRWRMRLPALPDDAGIVAACRDGIRLVCPGDSEWPTELDQLGPARPYALWVRGSADLLASCRRSVSVVGSRAATGYGGHIAGEIAANLGERGWTVVSGGAYGVDAAAHRGALATNGITVAVLACGVDFPYPAGHADLFAAIAADGLLLSEWPPGQHPGRQRFLIRNRVIAALTVGTVVVEAGERSGALNTARHAAELGKPLMAVPGPVTSAQSAGCHRIIREWAATCVTCAADIIEMLSPVSDPAPNPGSTHARDPNAKPGPSPDPTSSSAPKAALDPRDELDPDSARVLDALPTRGTAGTSTIAVDAGMEIDTVLRCLGILAGYGFIERGEGGWRLHRRA